MLRFERLRLMSEVQFAISIREGSVAFTSRLPSQAYYAARLSAFQTSFHESREAAEGPPSRELERKPRVLFRASRGDGLSEVLTRIGGDSLFTGRIEPAGGSTLGGIPKTRIFHRRFPFESRQTGYSDK